MSTPIYLNTDGILQKCRKLKNKVLLIVAPTGTGKTLGIRQLIFEHPTTYGKTILVQPTKMASFMDSIHSITPNQLIRQFLFLKKFDCDTLVIDEVHSMCVEYHTILSILQKTEYYKKIKVILMSATPNLHDLEKFFPIDLYTIPVSSPFHINVQYTPLSAHHGFATYSQMAKHVVELLQRYPDHSRVLVFLYTHYQCEKMTLELKDFATSYNQGKTFALYGGMDTNDVNVWNMFLEQEENFIVFATNVAETSITIPHLSLIIDFGVRCIRQNNRIIYNYCPKSNLIQRSGRTGRTCHGVVLRCMSEEEFQSRPIQDVPEYNWDLIVLTILYYNGDPHQLLPDHVQLSAILHKFVFYQLVNPSGNLNKNFAKFIFQCPLLLKNACHLYYFLFSSKHFSVPEFVLYILATSIIDQMETRMSRIYYYSFDDLNIGWYKFLDKLEKIFIDINQYDELLLYMNIIISCMLNEKPVEFSNTFSLNFRSIRQIAFATTKLWSFLNNYKQEKTQETWQMAIRRFVDVKTALDFKNKHPHVILHLQEKFIDKLRYLYFINPLTPRFLSINDLIWRPNFIMETYNCIIPPFIDNNKHHRSILILSYDDTDIYQWFDPTFVLTNIITVSFSIYTLPPSRINFFIKNINEIIKIACFKMNAFRKKKEINKKKFQLVLDDIDQDIAYRPNFWKMDQSIQNFLYQYQLFSENK